MGDRSFFGMLLFPYETFEKPASERLSDLSHLVYKTIYCVSSS